MMNLFARTGMVVAALVLATNVGCSKSEAPASKAKVTATDVAGLTQETLLVLKFHHDN